MYIRTLLRVLLSGLIVIGVIPVIAIMPVQAQDTGETISLPITITDATGTEVTIESLDAIVSGSGDVTEIIDALGFYDNIIGVDTSSTYPEFALDEKEHIGFARILSVEPIAALYPSVFFCTQTCSPSQVIDQLRELGIPVVIVPDNEMDGLILPFQKIDMVAAALGVPERGEALKARIRLEMDWVQTALTGAESEPYVFHFYVRGRGLQLAGGKGTPAEYMIEAAGGHDAGVDAGVEGYQPLSPEIILTAYPDYLLLTEGNLEASGGLEEVLKIQGIADTPAGKNQAVIVMDTGYLLGMSTRVGQAIMSIAQALHPDIVWEEYVSYPYTYTDTTDTPITIETEMPVVALNDNLFDMTQKLGYHVRSVPVENSLILVSVSDDWQPLRESGYPVMVLEDNPSIEDVATALNVPGRGQAVIARFLNEQP